MTQIGMSICVLRSILPQSGGGATAWFALLRSARHLGGRSVYSEEIVDPTSPDQDVRIEIGANDESYHLAGLLAMIERSPLFIIDSGAAGDHKILLQADLNRLMAGSMGLVVPVPLEDQMIAAV